MTPETLAYALQYVKLMQHQYLVLARELAGHMDCFY